MIEYILVLLISTNTAIPTVTSQIVSGFKSEKLCLDAAKAMGNDFSDIGGVPKQDSVAAFKVNARCILRSDK